MEEKGEFEARPEARPAESVALPRAKASPVTKILCFVFALIAVGLGAFILYDKVINPFIGKAHPCPVKFEKETDKTAETTKKVKEIVIDERLMLMRTANNLENAFEIYQKYDEDPAHYDFEEGYSTSLEASFGLIFWLEPVERHLALAKNTDLYSKVREVLKNHSLKATSNVSGYIQEVEYYLSDDGYVCWFNSNSAPLHLECSHTSWLSRAKKDLVKQLADAYKKDENVDATTIYVDANPEDIETTANGEYQRIYGRLDNAGAWFYRKGTDGEWKFFTALQQQMLDCKDYDTDELKAAFVGTDCYDYENDNLMTVK